MNSKKEEQEKDEQLHQQAWKLRNLYPRRLLRKFYTDFYLALIKLSSKNVGLWKNSYCLLERRLKFTIPNIIPRLLRDLIILQWIVKCQVDLVKTSPQGFH